MTYTPFRIYSASAGAGKTYALTLEYLRICLATPYPKEFRRILAITFTNKAAAEMKHRILAALSDFSTGKPVKFDSMFQSLLQEQGLSVEELKQRSGAVLLEILHDYGAFSVGTIDQFTYRLVRTFAHDLGLPGHFEIELDQAEMQERAAELLLDKSGRDPQITALMMKFIDANLDEDRSWDPARQLMEIAHHLTREKSLPYVEKLVDIDAEVFIQSRDRLYAELAQAKKRLVDAGNKGLAILQKIGVDDKSYSSSAVPNFYAKLSQGEYNFTFATVQKMADGVQGIYPKTLTKTNPSAAQSIDLHADELREHLGESIALLLAEQGKIILNKIILSKLLSVSVIHELGKAMDEYAEAKGVQPLAKFNKLIHEELKSQPAPYIYERMGEKYKHFFIDEFQDTSVLQWQNLLPLIENALASDGTCMIVGDAKQSIYRWRGGEAEQFIDLIERAQSGRGPYDGSGLDGRMGHIPLADNYRSRAEVVQFNNRLFTAVADLQKTESYKNIYLTGAQGVKGKPGGGVQIQVLDVEGSELPTIEVHMNALVENILKILDQGQYQKSDIAVLVRVNNEGLSVVNALTAAGLPVQSAENLSLNRSADVQVLLNSMRLLLDETNMEARYGLMQALWKAGVMRWTTDEFFTMARSVLKAPFSTFEAVFQTAYPDFQLKHFKALGLYELGERLAHSFGLSIKASGFLQFFMDELYAFGLKRENHLPAFMEWWNEKGEKRSIAAPEGRDAIKVMSIHKSKGLEFPVVCMPLVSFEIYRRPDDQWFDLSEIDHQLPPTLLAMSEKNSEALGDVMPKYRDAWNTTASQMLFDTTNVIYVGFTRAVDVLMIQTHVGKSGTSERNVNHLLGHLIATDKGSFSAGSTYTYGNPFQVKETEKQGAKEARGESFEEFHSADWTDRVKLSRASEGTDLLEREARKWGTMVHDILAEIDYQSDVAAVLKRWAIKGALNEADLASIQQLVTAVVNHPELEAYYTDGTVYNERDILLPGAGTKRPDRLVHHQGRWTIIDYKTGQKSPSHAKQLIEYANLLQPGNPNSVEKLLIYIGDVLEVERVG